MTSRCAHLHKLWFVLLLMIGSAAAQASDGLNLLHQLNEYPHAQLLELDEADVLDYEVGLGAMQKVSGAWRFKHSERYSGRLTGYTWQIIDGFTSIEILDELVARLEKLEWAELSFECDGRSCGKGVQWANRVFHQPLLYGREDLQRYRVYSLALDPRNILVLYAASRTADRQYLHAEILEITP